MIKYIMLKLTRALREECNFEPVPINSLLNLPEFKYTRTTRSDIDAVLEYESRLGNANIKSWTDTDNNKILQAISTTVDVGPIPTTSPKPIPNQKPQAPRPPLVPTKDQPVKNQRGCFSPRHLLTTEGISRDFLVNLSARLTGRHPYRL